MPEPIMAFSTRNAAPNILMSRRSPAAPLPVILPPVLLFFFLFVRLAHYTHVQTGPIRPRRKR